jgi:hypothetical protein
MKHMKVIIVTLFVIVLGMIINPTKQTTVVQTFDPNTIKNIEFNLPDTDVNIQQGDSDEVIVEYRYNRASEKNGKVFNYIENDTLYVDYYDSMGKSILIPISTINIYIPKTTVLNEVAFNIDYGTFEIKDVDIVNLEVNGTENNVSIVDNKVDTLTVHNEVGNVELNNVVGNNVVINGNYGSFAMDNSSYSNVQLAFAEKGDISYNISTVDNLIATGNDNHFNFVINSASNYKITTSKSFKDENLFDIIDDEHLVYSGIDSTFYSVIDVGDGTIESFEMKAAK